MNLADLLKPEGIVLSLRVSNKTEALRDLSARAAELASLPARDIYDSLLQRERLGSTGVGRGIAIPHAKFSSLKSIIGLFARLEHPVDFGSIDNEPVDLIFLLLAPEHAGADHLSALARVSRLLREPKVVERLRSSADRTVLHEALSGLATSNAA
jgi:nitrogen PTS system EIIA component